MDEIVCKFQSGLRGGRVIENVVRVYSEYGFKCERKYLSDNVLVFTINNGYFNNAEVVSLDESSCVDKVFRDYVAAGYACTKRDIRSSQDVEQALFKGFFFVESTRERLYSDYQKFTKSITSFYSSAAEYRYIDAPYLVNDKVVDCRITDEIKKRLADDKPALFLIEAAAGFGKTCTAYELVNEILAFDNCLPLFSELSRNRSAKIFRYVLLDEIDRTFPQLKSRLVEREIQKGRVVVVLDGFDELLRKSESGADFESAEPMLETIGELLKERAKIILTTRRTVLFEGDDFHRWVDQSADKFDVYRFKLSEPRINDWLASDRLNQIELAGFDIEGIANPVLLSYLRCITDEEFDRAVNGKDELVAKYFTYMLERERTRQDLRLDVAGQYGVLAGIAKDMIDLGYTSEARDYIVDLIKSNFVKVLDDVRSSYASTEKPSRDEVANKLASHALLDKSAGDNSKIGFINEFVFGNFVAENILASSDWFNDDLRFVEPAVISYRPRGGETRQQLSEALSGVMEFLDWNSRVSFSCSLTNRIDFPLVDGEVDGLVIEGLEIGEEAVSQFLFNECTFKDCRIRLASLTDVTFLNCRFFGGAVISGGGGGSVHVLGCSGDGELTSQIAAVLVDDSSEINSAPSLECSVDRYILEKFWPVGTLNFHRRRPIKGICGVNNEFSPEQLYEGINSLKRRGIIFEPSKPSFVELSIDRIGEIRAILGRTSL